MAIQVPIHAQDPPMINRVCTVHKMTTLNITTEHKHHHRLQPGRCLNDHLDLHSLCQALEWGEDGEEGEVVSSINLFGDQTFLVCLQVGQALLFQVSCERLFFHILSVSFPQSINPLTPLPPVTGLGLCYSSDIITYD